MIVKTLFLAKIIHHIGARNLRDKKTLRENLVYRVGIYRITGCSHPVGAGRYAATSGACPLEHGQHLMIASGVCPLNATITW
jgi:hypothetical protein